MTAGKGLESLYLLARVTYCPLRSLCGSVNVNMSAAGILREVTREAASAHPVPDIDIPAAEDAVRSLLVDQLPLEWFDVLVPLADLPGMRAHQKELRDRVLLSESGVSRLLVRMEKAGLITRSTADDDRRSIEIAVTDEGRAALLAAIESHLQLVAALFSDLLTATAQAALGWVLSKLLARTKADADASAEARTAPI